MWMESKKDFDSACISVTCQIRRGEEMRTGDAEKVVREDLEARRTIVNRTLNGMRMLDWM